MAALKEATKAAGLIEWRYALHTSLTNLVGTVGNQLK